MLQRQFPKTLAEYERQIDFLIRELSPKGVKDREALATALYVAKASPDASADLRAKELRAIKPHVDMERARASVAKVDEWIAAVAKLENDRVAGDAAPFRRGCLKRTSPREQLGRAPATIDS